MKRKIVSYYLDLYPGWQDNNWVPTPNTLPEDGGVTLNLLGPGCRRFKISVELPCFGGSADAEMVLSEVNEMPKEVK